MAGLTTQFVQERAIAAKVFPALKDVTPGKVRKMKPSQMVELAGKCLTPKRWCQHAFLEGEFNDPQDCRVCVDGALQMVNGIGRVGRLNGEKNFSSLGDTYRFAAAALDEAAEKLDDRVSNRVEYNDYDLRSLKEMKNLVTTAIKILRKSGQ